MENQEAKVVDAVVVEAEITREIGDALNAIEKVAIITDEVSRAIAVSWGVKLTEKEKGLKDLRTKIVTPMRKAYENARDIFDGKLDAIGAGKKLLSARISAWDLERERLARLERERLEKQRREDEEKHKRELLAWEIERDHALALTEDVERVRLAEEKRQKDERAAALALEEQGRIEQADTAVALGMTDRVDTILDKTTAIAPVVSSVLPPTQTAAPIKAAVPAPPPPPPVPAALPVVARRADSDTVSRDEWHYEPVDMRALCKAIAEGRAPAEYVTLAKGEVGKDVRKLKDEFRCDGIRTWKERNTTFKTAKVGEVA